MGAPIQIASASATRVTSGSRLPPSRRMAERCSRDLRFLEERVAAHVRHLDRRSRAIMLRYGMMNGADGLRHGQSANICPTASKSGPESPGHEVAKTCLSASLRSSDGADQAFLHAVIVLREPLVGSQQDIVKHVCGSAAERSR